MKIGVFIDAENIRRSGGYGIRYDVLRDYVSQYGDAIRLNSYMSIDEARMRTDYEYKDRTNGFLSIVRSYGFKVITKAIRWFEDEDGQRIGKANADLDMAVDMLLQSQHLDTIYLLTGDGDSKGVQALQTMGIRVEIIAFRYISRDLLHEQINFVGTDSKPFNVWINVLRMGCHRMQGRGLLFVQDGTGL